MKTTRRSFVGAAGALSAWVVGSRALGNTPATAKAVADAGIRPDAGSPPQAPEGLVQAAHERYGKFLDDKQLKLLDAKLGEVEARSKRLHAFKVTNADEPACEFRPVRP